MWHWWDNASCPAQKWIFPQYPATPQYAQVRFVYVSSCWVIYSPHFSTEVLQSAPQCDKAEEPTQGCTPHFCPPSLDRSVQGNPLTREGARSEHSVAWVAPVSIPLLFLHSSGLFHAIHSRRMYSLMNCLKWFTRVWSKHWKWNFSNYRECPRSITERFSKDVKQHCIINKHKQEDLVLCTQCNRFHVRPVDSHRLCS